MLENNLCSFFRPTENKYEGEGFSLMELLTIPMNGIPLIKYLEKGALEFPNKTMFKMGDAAMAKLLNNLHMKRPIKNQIKLQIT